MTSGPTNLIGMAAAACLLAAGLFAAEPDASDAEIDFLIEQVATSDCTFIRNGREHDAEAASDHLQMKRRRGSRYFDTAEEFIERIASRSSWTGKPYRIRCGDDEVVAERWFTDRLADYRNADNPTDGKSGQI